MGTTRFILFCEKGQSLKQKLNINIKPQPVHLVYSLHGVRKFYSTKVRLYAANWNVKDQEAIYIDKKKAKAEAPLVDYDLMLSLKESERINTQVLGGLRNDILEIEEDFEKRFKKTGEQYSSDNVIKELANRNRGSVAETKTEVKHISKSFADIIQDFIDAYPTDKKHGSSNVYRNVKRYMVNYEKLHGIVKPEQINKKFMNDFRHHLNAVEKIANVTAHKQMSGFKTILRDAKNDGLNIPVSFEEFSMENPPSEIIALTYEEFLKIYSLDLSNNKRLDRTRDCFIFSCATGLRYSDLGNLNRSHIKWDKDQIETTIQKSGKSVPLRIPLISYSRNILEKYKDKLKPIPIISNVQFNRYVKEVGALAGMTEVVEKVRHRGNKEIRKQKTKAEYLTVHVGRKTYATLSLLLGVPEWAVRESGGWSPGSKAFNRYVLFSNDKKAELVKAAWDK